jgi:hypothetical protein
MQTVEQYYYSVTEWNRLGCGPLPPERDRSKLIENTVKPTDKDITDK